jgi:hypothetical protein
MDAGCSASLGLSDIYLLSLSYQASSAAGDPLQLNPNLTSLFSSMVGSAQLEVRTSYRGMCISQNGGGWACSSNAADLASRIRDANNADPLNLIWISENFRQHVIFDGLL